MSYLTLFERKIRFNQLWPLLDLRTKLDLRLTNYLVSGCLTTTTRRLFSARTFQSRLSQVEIEAGDESEKFRANWPQEYDPT